MAFTNKNSLRIKLKLTQNWIANFANILPPKTLDEAVDRLLIILSDSDKNIIANTPEQDLVDLHFSLGLAIRNGFGLHQPDSQLVSKCVSADDASMLIIRQLWKRLNAK